MRVTLALFLHLLGLLLLSNTQVKSTKSDFLFPIEKDGLTGFINADGNIILPPQFRGDMYGVRFSEGLAAVIINSKWAYIDESGKIVFTTNGDYAYSFSEGLAKIAVAGRRESWLLYDMKYGYIDKKGKIVIKPQFEETYGFSEGIGRIVADKKWGFIDKTGAIIIKTQFERAYPFIDGFSCVTLESGKRAYINKLGVIISNPNYEYSDTSFSEGLIPAKDSSSKWGYVDKNWKMVIEAKYEQVAFQFSDGLAAVKLNGKWGFIDKSGKMILEPQFEEGLAFSEGLASFRVNNKVGYMDKSGKVVIHPQFLTGHNFRGGLAAVNNDIRITSVACCWKKYDYINREGKIVWKAPELE